MKQIRFNNKLFFSNLLFSAALIIANTRQVVANSVKAPKLSAAPWSINHNNETATSQLNQTSKIHPKGNDDKLSAQTLVGGWGKEIPSNSGEFLSYTIFYNSDGTWNQIITLGELRTWYVLNGTWTVSDGILYEQTEAGKTIKGTFAFASNDTLIYQNEAEGNEGVNGEWQRISANSNLSAKQFVGTWSLAHLSSFRVMMETLIKLNPDGTLRYNSADMTYAHPDGGFIEESGFDGTWEYINNGYVGGILILKDKQGQPFSIGSVHWYSDGRFLYVNRSKLNENNELSKGKLEMFRPTDRVVD